MLYVANETWIGAFLDDSTRGGGFNCYLVRSTARRSSRKPVLKCSPKMVRISFDYTNQLVYMFS